MEIDVCEESSSGVEISNNMTITTITDQESLRKEMLNYLAGNKDAHFKSQQVGDPELNFEEKIQIAEKILIKSDGQFLAKFGRFILERHLIYFTNKEPNSDNYEVEFHLTQLRRFHSQRKNQVDIRNRRFEALKKLTDEGTYFSETEMRQRNPLLYEQLIGQYLTEQEIEDRDHLRRPESLVGLFIAQIERDQREALQKSQEDYEEGAMEEEDTDEESDEDSQDVQHPKGIGMKERELLKEEFYTYMYQSFLNGKDTDFDYSQVDCNPDMECLKVRTQDEEERYFDSESPELVMEHHQTPDSDDDLDVFMKSLQPECTPSDLATKLDNTCM